ncbi:signal transduction histidine kinase [Hoeflea marina]|uniref:histidine kinase n=1 Tax=Hoeflea marina TaxID=274592 RepID=A0A317PRY7_9HYPH|nr:histidine kinase dimerization/phosphoacceptor domain -containing protein [Hoeflea marina]PWW04222.1 signal transduction histidine kinase [Hoeflea marina]
MINETSGSSAGSHAVATASLEQRLRQQSLVAEFGRFALQDKTLAAILARACEIAAEGLGVRLAKVMEWRKSDGNFLIIAGIGWRDGVVGHATVPGGTESPAGFAFETGEPVISNHLDTESRFRTPAIMVEHDVKRAINVLIDGDSERFGVLEADSPSNGSFSSNDTNFLQSLANTLGVAIEKEMSHNQIRALNRELEESLRLKEMLAKEIDHRIKNSLSVVGSLLKMQARRSGNEEVKSALQNAASRISTIASVHGALYSGAHSEHVAFAPYLEHLGAQLAESHGESDLVIKVDAEPVSVASDCAVSLGILTAELITNAIKHAASHGRSPAITVESTTSETDFVLLVSDDGPGLPDGFDPASTSGLGMQIVRSLAKSLSGVLETSSSPSGAVFLVRIPLSALLAD